MDPMTQSAQISSSQGFADGQNSAAKESKLSDKRVVLGSDKPCEGVATSLRFPSQPGSFSPGNYGSDAGSPDGQPDSPIKTSPVSERIKALEALAAKKKGPDFRSDGGYSQFRDRHFEKSPSENLKSPSENQRFSTETPKCLTEKTKPFTETSKFTTETSKSPTETSKSPTEMSKSIEATKSPTEPSKSPIEATKSPTEPSKSPIEATKSPTEPSKSPIEATKSPTEPSKSPIEATKSPPEKNPFPTKKTGGSADPESPESPFEILGDLRQVSEFEETEEWMRAHLPPMPDFNDGSIKDPDNVASKGKESDIVVPAAPAAFAVVPDDFMDSPIEAPKLKDDFGDVPKQSSLEEEFDLSFLPTAYMWDQQDKSGVQAQSNIDSSFSSSPAPPEGFGSASPPFSSPADAEQKVSEEKTSAWTRDIEPPEASEADSSGESDDTVIGDGGGTPAPVPAQSTNAPLSNDPAPISASTAPDAPSEETASPPPKSERKLMQVPTINVIETDEPNYSEEEMEMDPEEEEDESDDAPKDPEREAPEPTEPEENETEPAKVRPLETEFMEGYSPPSSPVDSDSEYSPKHKILKSTPEAIPEKSQVNSGDQPSPSIPEDSATELPQADKSRTLPHKIEDASTFANEDVDFPDNDDEWSDEAREILVKPCTPSDKEAPCMQPKVDESNASVTLSKTSFMQDDIYDRQSFDYDYDASSTFDIDDKGLNNAKERFLSEDAGIHIETLNANPENDATEDKQSLQSNDNEDISGKACQREYPQDPYACFPSQMKSDDSMRQSADRTSVDTANENTASSKVQEDLKTAQQAPAEASVPEGYKDSQPTDSFVDFMRECLKSKQDEEPESTRQGVPSKHEVMRTCVAPSQPSPSMVINTEQEQLTITALKQLGSQEEEEEATANPQPSEISDRDRADPNTTFPPQSSDTSVANLPCAQSNPVFDSTYSKEVEAIDEWVAEAYHLAEHVLTAILTHLSVKDLIHWRDPKKSGLVFGLSLLLLLSLAAFSVISVASYLLLALLCVTITFRIYKSVVQAVQKSNDGHPFKSLIEKDVSIPPETFRKNVDASLTYINRALKQMSRLFLVEDLVDSLKLAVVMWLLTYVGAVFNGITILILADILLFAVPPIYEKNKTQIDQYIDLARTQVNTTIAKLQEKLPGAVKRSKTE